MSRLNKLYQTMDNLKELGLSINEDLIQEANELEEEIIKKEILPVLSKTIEPALQPVKRDLVLVVEYHPGEPISVALSRKAKISEIVDAKQLTPKTERVSQPVSSDISTPTQEPHIPTKQIVNVTKGLKVTFPDGAVIWHRQAIETFIEVLRRIGLDRIPIVGIKHGEYNLVDKHKRPTEAGRVWQHECDGWYVYSNISNSTKRDDLQKISDFFHLGLKIEEGKP